jgi:hypothetical protein
MDIIGRLSLDLDRILPIIQSRHCSLVLFKAGVLGTYYTLEIAIDLTGSYIGVMHPHLTSIHLTHNSDDRMIIVIFSKRPTAIPYYGMNMESQAMSSLSRLGFHEPTSTSYFHLISFISSSKEPLKTISLTGLKTSLQ